MMGWGGMGFGSLFFIALVGLVIYLIVRSGQTRGGSGTFDVYRETPLEIAKKRYARGEISREEFERLRRDLE